MLLELHTAATDYFRYTNRGAGYYNIPLASAKWSRVLELADRAGVTGVAFLRFKNKVAAQVANAR